LAHEWPPSWWAGHAPAHHAQVALPGDEVPFVAPGLA
jgi:hypothetical protein